MLALLAAIVLGLGHRSPAAAGPAAAAATGVEEPATTGSVAAKEVKATIVVRLGEIPREVPGRARVVSAGPAAPRRVALTFDDGFCARCVRKLVRAVERTGAHVTFCPKHLHTATLPELLGK